MKNKLILSSLAGSIVEEEENRRYMPCLIITGHPSAGKTTLSYLLKERALLHDDIDEVVVVNEESECGCLFDEYNNFTNSNNDNDNSNSNNNSNSSNNSNFNNKNGETKSSRKKDEKTQPGVATTKQELYATAAAEKQTRATLKSAFDRAVKKGCESISSRRLVIFDSLNYIKGYRYELHCISKAAGEKHGVLWVLNRLSNVQRWNNQGYSGKKRHSQERYSSDLLQELISRYEPPDSRNRWDQPLFTVDLATSTASSTNCSVLSVEEDETYQTGTDETLSTNKVRHSTRNEVVKQSVYNMHAIGDALGATSFISKTRTNDTSNRPTESISNPASPCTAKAPKKSAFQRKKKTKAKIHTNTQEKEIVLNNDTAKYNSDIPTTIGTCAVSNAIIESQKPLIVDQTSIPSNNTTKASHDLSCYPSSAEPQEINSETTTLVEQLDKILDTFLHKTNNLREGLSTRQYT